MTRIRNQKFTYFIFLITLVVSLSILSVLSVYNIENNIKSKLTFIHSAGPKQLNHQMGLMLDRLSIIKNYSSTLSSMLNESQEYNEEEISKILESHFLKELGIFQLRLLSKDYSF